MTSPENTPPEDKNGKAGASARREHERRKANRERGNAAREAAVRERHPRIGGLMLALQGTPEAPRHETVWAQGAVGEERVEQVLTERCPDVTVLHDRRVPHSRANIDHIAIAPTGVWVIDTKRYKGKVEVMKPWLGDAWLKVGGRNQTKLIGGLVKQVDLVKAAVADVGLDVPVQGCLCFVDAEWPVFGRPKLIDGCYVFWPKALAEHLNATGALTPEGVAHVAAALAKHFRPA